MTIGGIRDNRNAETDRVLALMDGEIAKSIADQQARIDARAQAVAFTGLTHKPFEGLAEMIGDDDDAA